MNAVNSNSLCRVPVPLPLPLPHPPVKLRMSLATAPVIPAMAPPAGAAGAAAVGALGLTMADGVMMASIEKLSGFCPVVVMAATVVFCTAGVVTVNVVSCGCVWAAGGAATSSPAATNPPSPPSKSGGSCMASKSTVPPKMAMRRTCRTNEMVKNLELLNLSISLSSRLCFSGGSMGR